MLIHATHCIETLSVGKLFCSLLLFAVHNSISSIYMYIGYSSKHKMSMHMEYRYPGHVSSKGIWGDIHHSPQQPVTLIHIAISQYFNIL